MIVFPAIDLRRGQVVRLEQGQADAETVYDDDPVAVARRWVAQGAEWLHVINLDGALGGAAAASTPAAGGWPATNLQKLAEICTAVPQTPVQFGGGLRLRADIEAALEAGAARVLLGTAAVCRPELVTEALRRFGAERIAVAIDHRAGRVLTHGWLQSSDVGTVALGKAMRKRGVRYALYTDTRRDGLLRGANVGGTAALARATGLRVIAAGGVASVEDVRQLRQHAEAGIEGVVIGQALYRGTISLTEAIREAR